MSEPTNSTPTPSQSSAPEAQNTENLENTQVESAPEEQESEETTAEASEEGKTEPKKSAEQKKIEKQLKKLKIKYNGKEEDIEFDPNDDAYLAQQFQLAKLGHTNAKDKAEMQKQIAAFFQDLQKNPRKVLENPDLGIDFKKVVDEYINEQLENSKKSPEQLEKEKLQAELQRLQDERKREQEEMKQREFQRMQEEAYQNYDMQMAQAIEKSDLPKSPYVVKKMADYMLMGIQNGIDITPEDVLPLVREEIQNDIKEMFAVMPEDIVEKIVGKDTLGKLRKKSVAKAKAAIPAKKAMDVAKNTDKKTENKKPMTFKQFFRV